MFRNKLPLVLVSFVMLSFVAPTTQADSLIVTPTNSAATLANTLLAGSSGIVINSSTYTGATAASSTFTGGTGILGFESGIVMTTGTATSVVGPNTLLSVNIDNSALGTGLISGTTFNASVLTINFTPTGNNISFNYVFSSEEYNEFVGSIYNDAFVFLVNGTNYALIPGTTTPVEINNLNNGSAPSGSAATGTCTNCAFYRDNAVIGGLGLNTSLDGLTVVLSFTAPVNNGVANDCAPQTVSAEFREKQSSQRTGRELHIQLHRQRLGRAERILPQRQQDRLRVRPRLPLLEQRRYVHDADYAEHADTRTRHTPPPRNRHQRRRGETAQAPQSE